jgi:outer membrane receptor protein involved in Fe transport
MTGRLGSVPAPRSASTVGLAVAAILYGSTALHGSPAWGASAAAAASDQLDEIIVTSRKREENLQDVPISVDVYSKKDLQNLAIAQFEDYATLTPSVNFVSTGPGSQIFTLRGGSDGSNPNYANSAATGFLVDDMSMNYYGTTPDIHWYDISQIEVLNGPQGTTYGAGAMFGAIRFITNKPDPNAFSAGVDFNDGKIANGGNNTDYEGFINIPLVDGKTALRISVYNSYHGGFIDNLLTTRNWLNGTTSNNAAWAGKDYNTENVNGARVALKQVFSDQWSATLTTSYQSQHAKGAWDEATYAYTNSAQQTLPVWGEDNVSRFGPEWRSNYTRTLDFHVDGDVGIGDLVYASTFWGQDNHSVNEYSEYMQYANTAKISAGSRQAFTCLTDPYYSQILTGTSEAFSGCKVPTLYYDYSNNTDRWSNEVRLQSKAGGSVHWLAGLYWERTRDLYGETYHMPGLQTASQGWQYYNMYYNQVTQPPTPDDWYSYVARADYRQVTEFGNVTFDLSGQWSLELGTTHFRSVFNTYSYGGNWYVPQSPSNYGGSSNKWDSKVDVNFKAAENVLLYATISQGFRDGGVNGGLTPSCTKNGVPNTYSPDTVTNYEFGWKTTPFGGRMMWNGAVYYMPWKNFQTALYDPDICLTSGFNANIGNARVYGSESTLKWKAADALTLELNGSYNDSRLLTNSFYNPSFTVAPGERLPYVPYFNYSAVARYEAPFNDAFKDYVQFDLAHKGDMWNDLSATNSNGFPRILQPGYTIMDLRAGISPSNSSWGAELYVTNLANKNAITYSNTGNFDIRQTVVEPRVIGVRVNYRFGKVSGSGSE